MKVKPVCWTVIVVRLTYNFVIYAIWAVVGADYTDLVSHSLIVERLVHPEMLGVIFMVTLLSMFDLWHHQSDVVIKMI